MRRTRVYIASPYSRGDKIANVVKSLEVAERLIELGYAPYCPLLTHFYDTLFPHPADYWLALDLEWLKASDVVLRLDGASDGADREVAVAIEQGIKVVFSLSSLAVVPATVKD